MYWRIYRIKQLIFSRPTCASGDSLAYHLGQKFSTRDQDNDAHALATCTVAYKGGWWYRSCHTSNLNGVYKRSAYTSTYYDGVVWEDWKGVWYSLRYTEMKIRPFDYRCEIDTKAAVSDI